MPIEPPITLTHLIAIAGVSLAFGLSAMGIIAQQFKSRLDLQAQYTAETMQRHGELAVSFAGLAGTIQSVESRVVARIDVLTGEVKAINGRLTRTESALDEDHVRMLNLIEQNHRIFTEILADLRNGRHQGES